MKISAPCHLEEQHNLEPFSCGEMVLDDWLKTRSRKNEASGASRTYVITRANDVVGYYSLAVGSVSHMLVPGKIRRNMPDPIPVMLLARLAVDTSIQGKGMGRALLRDAILRTEQAAHIAGIRAMLVHALHERAKVFYRGCGFTPSPINELTLMLPMPAVRAGLTSCHLEEQHNLEPFSCGEDGTDYSSHKRQKSRSGDGSFYACSF